MEQNRPLLISSENVAKIPILIVDKKGPIGSALAKLLREQFLVVVVSAQVIERQKNVIHIPYRRKIPMIPDNVYSHIFLVYNGESELLDMLPVFEEKAEVGKSRLFFITSLLYSSAKLFKKLQHPQYRLLQPVLYGEVFSNAIADANEVNFYIHQVRTYGRIEVPNEGLGKLFPISFDDVLTSIVSLAFAVEPPKKPILLFPHHSYTQITVARILQTIDPFVKVDFHKKESKQPNFYIPPDGLYFFRNYNLEERLRKIDLSRVGNRRAVPQKKIRLKLPSPYENKSQVKIFSTMFVAVFFAPLVILFLCMLLGAGLVGFSARQLEQGNIQSAEYSATIAQNAFLAAQSLEPTMLLLQVVAPQAKNNITNLIETGKTIALSEASLFQALQTMKNIYNGQSSMPREDFLHALATVKNTLLTVQQLEAENKLPLAVEKKLHNVDGTINLVEETIDTWPNLLGFDGKKTYLVLFQNNMELRPGGGFIGSYGVLPVANGKIGKLQIHDVYDADGQLTQSIQPPYGLQRYLGASHWFLRDSNFDPDFTRDAAQAEQFLQKETGQKVDGVIAIDTTFLQELISVVGSVTVPEYHVTVTPDNFYLLTETNAEKNFFPGSTQKKDFLLSLSNALINKLTTEKRLPYEKFAQMAVTSVKEKHLLTAFVDPGVQNAFTVNNLSSSLWDDRQPEKHTSFDFFGVVDANVGANKANYYVKRSMTQLVTIDDAGGLQATAAATYQNTSTKSSPFGGAYKDYVRFLLPANATLESVSFDKNVMRTQPAVTDPVIFTSPDFTPPAGLEVEQTQELGKTAIGFFFIVPVNTTRTVSITYHMPGGEAAGVGSIGYSLKLFKQPGAGDDPYQITLVYPQDANVVAKDPVLSDVGGKLLYDGQLAEDRELTATFAKQ